MPFVQSIPISMTALNQNIDQDLIFTSTFSRIGQTIDNSLIQIRAGTLSGNGGLFASYGSGGAGTRRGDCSLWVIDAALATYEEILRVRSGYNGLYIDAVVHLISRVKDPVGAQDAATKNYVDGKFPAWMTWSPTLTWATATPTGLTTSYRYWKVGKTVFYVVFIQATDSNATTGLTFTLPETPVALSLGSAIEASGVGYGTLTALMGYADTDGLWHTFNFVIGIDNQGIIVRASGFYEVA